MLRIIRRPETGRAAFMAHVEDHRNRVSELVAADNWPEARLYLVEHPAWRDIELVKSHFSSVQERRCGYCERHCTGPAAIDHFRPKLTVEVLIEEGYELEHVANVRGHRGEAVCGRGYWWLAYDWDNFVFSCEQCNSRWKKAFFPVVDRRPGNPVPGDERTEVALLLDPFGDDPPEAHLSFDSLGQVEGITPKGRETVRTLGLARESLRQARQQAAETLFIQLNQVFTRKQSIEGALPDLLRWGRGTCFPGMVRCIVKQQTDCSWEDIEAIALEAGIDAR